MLAASLGAQIRDRQAWIGAMRVPTSAARVERVGDLKVLLSAAICLAVMAIASPLRAEDGAVARLTQNLAAQEAKEGQASPLLLPIVDQLAQAQWQDGALSDAAASRQRALSITNAAFGADSAKAVAAMVALARLDIDRRRYLDAEPLLIVAHTVLEDRAGEAADPAMVTVLAGLARVALARGETKVAVDDAGRAVALARQIGKTDSAEPWRVYGAALTATERFAEAEQVLTEALATDRKQHGADSIETARSLSGLGNLYLRQHQPADALPLIEHAAAIDQNRLGPTHPFIADDFFDLGLAYDALKRPADARRAFTAAITILERGPGRETPRLAYAETELSRLDRQEGNDAAAERAFKDAKRILHRSEMEERKREGRA
jgi:tetratricopeptide (TPR) repeat protein